MNAAHEAMRDVTALYLAAAEAWQGCDWVTVFGPRSLDLNRLKARQTRLLAEATSGDESRAWSEATHWLEQVERDARNARSAASSAVDLFTKQQKELALARITEACELESKYREALVWGPLRDLIALESRL